MTQLSNRTKARIAQLLAGGISSGARIHAITFAEGLPGSESTVKRYLRELREAPPKVPHAARSVAPVVQKADAGPYHVAALSRLADANERVARCLADGASVVDALLEEDVASDALFALSSAADFADLAELAIDDFGCGFELDEDQTDEEFAAEMLASGQAERAKQAALLESAAALIRSRGVESRWVK